MELFGEQIHTQVTVLTSLAALADPDDLTWSSLKHEKVTDPNEVAWDGDGVSGNTTSRLDVADSGGAA